MSSKKWVLVFLVTVFVLAALLAGLNLAADPFGAFGDRLLHWFSYDETNNPRVAKLSYLEQHHGEYDSYILGCSSTSSFPVDGFNELYDASFYNLIMYGADMRDCEKIADYLIGHYEVKNLVLNVYLDNGLEYDEESDRLTKNLHYKEDPDTSVLSYYTRYLFADPRYALAKLKALRTDTILPQTFDVFDEQTGCYDKRVRDAEPIGAMDSYLERYPVFTDYPHQSLSLPYTDACMQSVAAIKARCEAAGVNLVVSGQQQQSFAVGDIGKITFTESTMDVYGKDSGKIGTFSLSDITKLFFSDKEGNVTEINPDGALKFAKTGNTLKVDGLSAATDAFIVSASGRIVMQQKQWDGNSLDISSLTDGVYILAVGNAAFKFIKQ